MIRFFLCFVAAILINVPFDSMGKSEDYRVNATQVSVAEIGAWVKRAQHDPRVKIQYTELSRFTKDSYASNKKKDEDEERSGSSGSSGGNLSGRDLNFDPGDGAKALFVIIGVIVVIAFIAYGVYYFSKPSTYEDPTLRLGVFHRQIGENHTYNVDAKKRDGQMNGVTIDLLGRRKGPSRVALGLNLEIGEIQVTDKIKTRHLTHDRGTFALLGPSIVFGRDFQFFINLTGGATDLDKSKLISQTKMGFRLPFGGVHESRLSVGGSIGALYLDKEFDQGLTGTESHFHYTATLDVAWEW